MVLWQIHTERLSCPSSSCPLPRIQVPPEAAEHMLLQKGLNVGFPRKHTVWLTPQARSSRPTSGAVLARGWRTEVRRSRSGSLSCYVTEPSLPAGSPDDKSHGFSTLIGLPNGLQPKGMAGACRESWLGPEH